MQSFTEEKVLNHFKVTNTGFRASKLKLRHAERPGLAAEHLFQNGGLWAFLETNFLG